MGSPSCKHNYDGLKLPRVASHARAVRRGSAATVAAEKIMRWYQTAANANEGLKNREVKQLRNQQPKEHLHRC